MTEYRMTFAATADDIDELGHVNNAVWVRWIQDIATAHWYSLAPPEWTQAHAWVVLRHEIDYRGNMREGEAIEGHTWVPEGPKGARFERHVAFGPEGKRIVTARSTWAMIDRATGRVQRIPREIGEMFVG